MSSSPGLVNAQNVTDVNQVVCYTPSMMLSNGMWNGKSPLSFTIPVFVIQLTLIILTSRILVFLLKPFKQPRVVAEILAGLVLGPSVMGRVGNFGRLFFPLRSVSVLETMANLGLLYFLFLVGVEMDLSVIRRTGKKAMAIAVGGMILPFFVGFISTIRKGAADISVHRGTFVLFVGVCITITAFPVLARILAELKLLNTDLGRIAISSSIINALICWILLALAIALSENNGNVLVAFWIIISGATFIFFCIYVVRPLILWVIKRTPDGEPINEMFVSFILAGVMLSGFVGDAIGIHAVFGSFVYGLVIPSGPLGASLIERLEDFISGVLLPLFFAISGLRADIAIVTDVDLAMTVVVTVLFSCVGKVFGTVVTCRMLGMPVREGLSLGMLLNTKGMVEMIILNVGREQKVIPETVFVMLVISSVVVTISVAPIVTSIYRPARRFTPYKRRTIQRTRVEQELRVLVGIHNPRTVPSIINFLEATHPTKRSPVFVFALHLVELTGRASAMMIAHNSRKNGRAPVNRTQANSDQIASAFENYQQQSLGVSAATLTAISPYSSMHEDICDLAEGKRAALILLPFHKEQTVDGSMESTNPAFRTINSSVLANAPCSVGILIDRGLGGAANRITSSTLFNQVSQYVGVLFFGGPDDREALACACRMAEHPSICLTIVRFIEDTTAHLSSRSSSSSLLRGGEAGDTKMLTLTTDEEKERQLDEDYVNQFRLRHASNESVVYVEKVVRNSEETVATIRGLDNVYDLFIVGRGQGFSTPLTAGLTDWSECPELGPIGDLLASSDYAATVTVLVVQQYVGATPGEGVGTPDSPGVHLDHYLDDHLRRPQSQGSPF